MGQDRLDWDKKTRFEVEENNSDIAPCQIPSLLFLFAGGEKQEPLSLFIPLR